MPNRPARARSAGARGPARRGPGRAVGGSPGERGRRGRADVRARDAGRAAGTAARRAGAQLPVRPGEHRPHVGRRVAVASNASSRPLGRAARRPASPSGGRVRGAAGRDDAPAPAAAGRSARRRSRRPRPARRRPGPARAGRSSAAASSAVSRSSVDRVRAVGATRPASWSRLVTTTRQPRPAGQQRPDLVGVAGVVQHHQHPPAGHQAAVQATARRGPAGMPAAATPSAVAGTPASASPAVDRLAAGSKPRRFTYSWPSGNRSATRCAQCTASAVLPTPAVPTTAMTGAGVGGRVEPGDRRVPPGEGGRRPPAAAAGRRRPRGSARPRSSARLRSSARSRASASAPSSSGAASSSWTRSSKPVGRRQDLAGEVSADAAVRPAGAPGQLPVGQRRVAAPPGLPPAQVPQQLGEVLDAGDGDAVARTAALSLSTMDGGSALDGWARSISR